MIPAHTLAATRRDERAASRARVELRVQRERHQAAERKARDILKDAIVASGVSPHAGTTIMAATDSLRKAAVVAALADRIEPEPGVEALTP